VNKVGIALKVLKSPTGRHLLSVGIKVGLKNKRVRGLLASQVQKQIRMRLLGK
jgi:hypothetical protein